MTIIIYYNYYIITWVYIKHLIKIVVATYLVFIIDGHGIILSFYRNELRIVNYFTYYTLLAILFSLYGLLCGQITHSIAY